jgi:hypothetical protein
VKVYDRLDGSGIDEVGPLAEVLYTVLPGLVNLDSEGRPDGVKYFQVLSYMLQEIQELKKRIDLLV